MSTWNDPELISLFSKETPLIDVRAPIEFKEGSIPFSVNLPIMNDEERKAVGTCYKEEGQAKAIELGHSLVSGQVKEERIRLWSDFLRTHPEAEVFCFRGGLRSQISCQWLREMGIQKKPIPGGQKRLRRFFLSWLDDAPFPEIIRLGGLTGSGKTNFLTKMSNHIDLEGLANHRGSAFGPKGEQPSQITFENNIALFLMKLRGEKRIIIEDESATLGKVVVPRRLFTSMRASSLVILDVDPEERLQNIFNDYVKNSSADFFLTNLIRIQKKLGKAKTEVLMEEIKIAFSQPREVKYHEKWIMTLLHEYYDPLYQKDLRYNTDKIIFKGKEKELISFLSDLKV
jgi:tRNA 2-selenouridine synthase